MDVAHVGLVHRDPCECKVKGFRAVSSIERNVSKRRHLQGVRQSTCKHILALQLITKEYYPYVSVEEAPCPSTNLDPIIETTMEDAYNEILTNESTIGCDTEKGDLLQVIGEMESTLVEVKSSIGTYGKEEAKYKIDIIKACM